MDKKQALKEIEKHAEIIVYIENINSCFDAILDRGRKYIVKILKNIDSFGKNEANDLIKISSFFNSTPFIIGEYSNNGYLEDYLLFKRYSIFAGTVNTFLEYMNDKALPIKGSSPYYKIDGAKMRKLREKKKLSLNELSSKVGISKETLYRYEKGLILAGKSNLESLEKLFNEKLCEKVGHTSINKKAIGDFHGFKTNNPFNYLLEKEQIKIIAGKQKSTEKIRIKYSLVYKEINDKIGVEYFFITNSRIDEPYILESELRRIGFSEDLISLLEKRKK